MNSLTREDICNMALAVIGAAPIINIEDSETKEAKALNRFYDSAREAVLQEAEWSFALKFATLAVSGETNNTDYTYMYVIPPDLIMPIAIEDYEVYPFEIIGGYFYCDISEAVLKYIWNISDTTKFDPGFARALAHRLASDLVMYLKTDNVSEYVQKYEYELKKAIGRNLVYRKNRKTRSVPYAVRRLQGNTY